MKNIHILPTDKPSRLHIWINDKGLRATLYEQPQLDTVSSKNIYITSDEEIKQGEYRLHIPTDVITKWEGIGSLKTRDYKKIILTTDQDLIKDGVQAIDDDFLEWFVENPSCEFVNFEYIKIDDARPSGYKIIIPKEETKYPIGGYAPGNYTCKCSTCKNQFQGDKRAVQCEPCAIKMTKEEPKQVLGVDFEMSIDDDGLCVEVPIPKQEIQLKDPNTCEHFKEVGCIKDICDCYTLVNQQETLEEAAKRILANNIDGLRDALKDDDLFFFYKGVIQCYGEAMAKWQVEQDKNKYSEEDVREAFNVGRKFERGEIESWRTYNKFTGNQQPNKEINFDKWFEQFKKKPNQ